MMIWKLDGVNHLCSCKLAASGGALALAGKQPQLNSRQTSKNILKHKNTSTEINKNIKYKYTKSQKHTQKIWWYTMSEEVSTQQLVNFFLQIWKGQNFNFFNNPSAIYRQMEDSVYYL